MPDLIFLPLNNAYLDLPRNITGWISWIIFLGIVLYLLHRWRGYNQPWERKHLVIFIVLLILVPVTSVILPGFQLSVPSALPLPNLPAEPEGPIVTVLAALPWLLAGFIMGPSASASLAALSGLLLAILSNHNPYLPLEMAGMACIYSALVNQRYRTHWFRALRQPLIASLIIGMIYPVIYLISTMLFVQGSVSNKLDYTTNLFVPSIIAMGIGLFVSGIFAQIIYIFFPQARKQDKPLIPSPAESSLESRFLYTIGPISLILILILMVTNWIIADNVAREMLYGRMVNAAELTAESIPVFRSVGESMIRRFAQDERLYTLEPEIVQQLLEDYKQSIPYFRELIVLDSTGDPIAVSSPDESNALDFSKEELLGINLAFAAPNPVEMQSFVSPPLEGESSVQITYIAAYKIQPDESEGVLIGRSDLSNNPYAPPMLLSLQSLEDIGGSGILIDKMDGIILYHPDPDQVMETYTGRIPQEAAFFEDTAYDGTRQLVYVQVGELDPWVVIITVPAHLAQQQALRIIGPILILATVLLLIGYILIRFGLRYITRPLQSLTAEANKMSQGTLDQPLEVKGEDETGQLGRAFEKMRANLKARLDELNDLFSISRTVASSLDIEDSLIPVLESALSTGASSSRVVLEPSVLLDINEQSDSSISYGVGSASEVYKYLDDQVLSLTKKHERILLANLSRPRLLNFPQGYPHPQALMAVALQHENFFYGTFWVGYDQTHYFTNEEQRFLDTLAGLAALAVANAHLFQSAEIGRQRLEAIVASTPDPVLVTDYQNHILLANPAAIDAFGSGVNLGRGQLIADVISDETLIQLLQSSKEKIRSAEVVLPDDHIYLATSSSVILDGKRMGRVCVFRDVTQFKKLDALKSEFVSTVSHDLRSPLSLIRGYTTMLQMVGELNRQQTSYVDKIIGKVDDMSRLVNNLLDLGRIEAGVGLQLEMVPVHDILEKVVSGLRLQAAQKHINLDYAIPDKSVQLIEADQALLEQALHNLVENSIKYTDANGSVKVILNKHGERVVFEVRDNGIGIAPADQQRLFEKFYRAARRGPLRDHGTGLGLTIVKSIAERHGGRVWLESNLGKGSVFYLEIPVHQETQIEKNVVKL